MKLQRQLVIIALAMACLWLAALPASAQTGGAICLFADTQGNNCTGITDQTSGLLQVHAVYTQGTDIGAVQFMAQLPECMASATWIADTSPFPLTIGDSQTGIAIGLGGCLSGPVHLLTISIFGQGLTPNNCAYSVDGHPETDLVEVVDCFNNKLLSVGGTTFINSSLPCLCNASTSPLLSVSPTALDFGNATSILDFDIMNTGGGVLTWNVIESIPWLAAIPLAGSGDEKVFVGVDRHGLAPGNYTGEFLVSSNGGVEDVLVSMDVDENPILNLSTSSLNFFTSQTEQGFFITNVGNGTLNWQLIEDAPWLTVSQTSGVDNATITVTIDRTGLPPGNYSEVISVTSNGGNGAVTVVMEVAPSVPILSYSPSSFSFGFDETAKLLTISNVGTGSLDWVITPSEPWLSATPSSGSNNHVVTVSVDRSGLSDGTYFAQLQIVSNGGSVPIQVSMTVLSVPLLNVSPSVLVYQPTVTTRAFNITNVGAPTLTWSLGADQGWIEIEDPQSGSGDATVTVHVDVDAALASGITTGHVTVTSNGGTASVLINVVVPSGGEIGLYADPGGVQCEIIDAASGLLTFYVVHTQTPGSMASQFWAPKPGCMTGAVWIGDESPHPIVIGDSQMGVSVAYAQCVPAPIHVLTINYFAQGLTSSCCLYPLLPDPGSLTGEIEIVDCGSIKHTLNGSPAMMNPNGTCPCGVLVDVEDTTWGQIKSLYIDWDTQEFKARQKR